MARLKLRGSYPTSEVANKFLNVCEWVEMVERNKDTPFPCCSLNRQCLWKKTLREKNSSPWAVNLRWHSQPGCDQPTRERRYLTGGHTTSDGRRTQPSLRVSRSVCNFQFIKSPLEQNSLFLKFFCYVTWFDEMWNWRPFKQSVCASNAIVSSKQ